MSKAMSPLDNLGQLQERSRDELLAYDKSADFRWGDGLSKSGLIRTIIRLAAKERFWQGEENAESLRGFWYNPVKPLMKRIFPDADDTKLNKDLSRELSEMVLEGEISYRELNILDSSRQRTIRDTGIEGDKILFIEKDAAFRKLKPLADVYDLSIISGGGRSSTAMIEDIGERLDKNGEYHLFVFTDYDPAGFDIARDFSDRSKKLGLPVVEVSRVGINPEHVNQDTRDIQRFQPPRSKKRQRVWADEYGIDGRYGLEIEAIEGADRLREVAVETLQPHISPDSHRKNAVENAIEANIRHAVHDVRKQLIGDLDDALQQVAIEMVDDVDGVSVRSSFVGPKVTVEDVPDDERAPTAFATDELHDSATSGTEPRCERRQSQELLTEHIQGEIQNGTIDVKELLKIDGDESA